MAPANQRLDPGDAAVLERDDRLKVEKELLALDRVTEVGLQLQPGERLGVHGTVEHLEARPSGVLGPVHRHVRAAEEVLGLIRRRCAEGNSHARGGHVLVAADVHGLIQRLLHAIGDHRAVAYVGHALEQDRELVTAQSGDDVASAHAFLQPPRHRDQHLVAHVVAHRVVHQLEVIEVEEQHREDAVVVTPRAVCRIGQALHEERAVGQPGQRVVQRVVLQLLLARLALGEDPAQMQLGRCYLRELPQQRDLARNPVAGFVVEGAEQAEHRPVSLRQGHCGDADDVELARRGTKHQVALRDAGVAYRKRATLLDRPLEQSRAEQRARVVRVPVMPVPPGGKAPPIGPQQSQERGRHRERARGDAHQSLHGRRERPAEHGVLAGRLSCRVRDVRQVQRRAHNTEDVCPQYLSPLRKHPGSEIPSPAGCAARAAARARFVTSITSPRCAGSPGW